MFKSGLVVNLNMCQFSLVSISAQTDDNSPGIMFACCKRSIKRAVTQWHCWCGIVFQGTILKFPHILTGSRNQSEKQHDRLQLNGLEFICKLITLCRWRQTDPLKLTGACRRRLRNATLQLAAHELTRCRRSPSRFKPFCPAARRDVGFDLAGSM